MCIDVQPFVKYKPGRSVNGLHTKKVIDAAIAIPNEVRSDDGRRFRLCRWKADVPTKSFVEVTMTCTVSLPEGSYDE